MARFNEILVGRHNRFLQKYFGLKGGPPAPQLSSEVQPTFELESAMNVENRFVHSWRIYGGLGTGAAGGAGNRSAVQLFNPLSSGVIAVVEKITIVTPAADNPTLSRGTPSGTNFTAGVAQGSRDFRQVGVSSLLLKTSVNAGALTGFLLWTGATAAAAEVDVIQLHNQEIVIMPGDFITVWANVLNQLITTSFFWRERALEEGEVS